MTITWPESWPESSMNGIPDPTPEEVREYRLDADDPEMRQLNWDEWRAHRLMAEADR